MILVFFDAELDLNQRELRQNGAPVSISPKAFDLLAFLSENRHRMVAKSELMAHFWSKQTSEAALQKAISQARRALSFIDSEVIKTYHGRGFRFVVQVEIKDASDHPILPPCQPKSLNLVETHLAGVLSAAFWISDPMEGLSGATPNPEFFECAKEFVTRYEGVLLRMMPSGFTAVFGVEPFREDGVRQAVHCAADLLSISETDRDIWMSFAVDTGRFDTTKFKQGDAWAVPDSVERQAISLSNSAAPNDILITEACRRFLRNEAELAPKNDAFSVRSIVPLQAGVPDRPRRKTISFKGRDAELDFLNTKARLLADGQGQAALVAGPPGIGKTRLVTEFLSRVNEEGTQQLLINCLPALRNSPAAPIRQLCSIVSERLVGPGALNELDQALLCALVDNNPDERALAEYSDHQRRQLSCDFVDRLLVKAAQSRSLLLVFEDVHWIDATSRDYLETLLRGVSEKPLMIVMTTRPVEGVPLTDSVLNLPPLNQQQGLELFSEVIEGADIATDYASAIVERAEGNPFYIEELALVSQMGGDAATDLPTTVQSVIETRIGTLKTALRHLLYVISVIGPSASPALIAHLSSRPVGEIEWDLGELIKTGFLTKTAEDYSFRHMLIQDTAYNMISVGDRVNLHFETAKQLERLGQHEAPEHLAWHFQEANKQDRAIDYWIAASRRALRRSARHEAISFAESGLKLLGSGIKDQRKRELDLLMCLGPAVTALRGFGSTEVGRVYRRAEVLNTNVGNPKSEIRVGVGLWIHTWVQGDLTASLRYAGKLLDLSKQFPDPALVLQAHASRGQVLVHLGKLSEAMGNLASGLAAIENAPPETAPAQNAATSCAAYASWAACLLGREAEREIYLARSKALSEMEKNPFSAAIHFALCSETYCFAGDVPSCLQYADQAVRLSQEHDFVFWLGTGLVVKGWALGQQQAFSAAFEALDEGIDVFERTGAGVQLANWYGLKAETLVTAEQPEAALQAGRHALSCAAKAEDIYFTPRIHQAIAHSYQQLGRPEKARKHFATAQKLAQNFGLHPSILSGWP